MFLVFTNFRICLYLIVNCFIVNGVAAKLNNECGIWIVVNYRVSIEWQKTNNINVVWFHSSIAGIKHLQHKSFMKTKLNIVIVMDSNFDNCSVISKFCFIRNFTNTLSFDIVPNSTFFTPTTYFSYLKDNLQSTAVQLGIKDNLETIAQNIQPPLHENRSSMQ